VAENKASGLMALAIEQRRKWELRVITKGVNFQRELTNPKSAIDFWRRVFLIRK